MNLDDETLLSAFLDDELDPADRLAVAWSIEADPARLEQLHALILTREVVASLPRPEIPRDLAAKLGTRIAANRRRDRFRKLANPARVVLAFSGFTAVAASLIFALILLNPSLHENPPVETIPDQVVENPRTHLPVPDSIVPEAEPIGVAALPPVAETPSRKAPLVRPELIEEARERDVRRVIAGMLEQPHVRRIRIVTDMVDASKKVKSLIDQDGRLNPDFGRISICQEIVIDPDCAEAVEVFAVPMDERDRRAFVGQLARTFPDLVEETGETSPELVTQLTEIGQVTLFRGTEAAPLIDPPHDLRPFIANRAEISPIHIVESTPSPLEATTSRDQGHGPKGRPPQAPASSTKSPNPSRDRVTVLVWVVSRPSRPL